MKAWIIRGTASGPFLDKVFLRPPTEAELAEKLDHELRHHGVNLTKREARELSVFRQEVEVVGAGDALAKLPTFDEASAPARLTGKMSDELAAEVVKGLILTDPEPEEQENAASVPLMQARGEAMIINPGDVGHVSATALGKE